MNQSENVTAAETQFPNTRVVRKDGFSESKRVVTRIAISHLTLFLLRMREAEGSDEEGGDDLM
jgi:hypothetical protein